MVNRNRTGASGRVGYLPGVELESLEVLSWREMRGELYAGRAAVGELTSSHGRVRVRKGVKRVRVDERGGGEGLSARSRRRNSGAGRSRISNRPG